MIGRIEKPVFIVGLPRSASKWIMNAINTYTECCIIHEMHIKRLWRKGNDTRIRYIFRRSKDGDRIKHLGDQIFSDQIIGCFWRMREGEYTIRSLTSSEINSALAEVKDGQTMISAFMEISRIHYGKLRSGARHPVHFLFLGTLLKWFPDARVLFLTRSMNDIAKSWRKKKVPLQANEITKVFWKIIITIQSYLNAMLAKPMLWSWRNDHRIIEISYNDLVERPAVIFQEICAHLDINFDPSMADDSFVYDSAYEPESQTPFREVIMWEQ